MLDKHMHIIKTIFFFLSPSLSPNLRIPCTKNTTLTVIISWGSYSRKDKHCFTKKKFRPVFIPSFKVTAPASPACASRWWRYRSCSHPSTDRALATAASVELATAASSEGMTWHQQLSCRVTLRRQGEAGEPAWRPQNAWRWSNSSQKRAKIYLNMIIHDNSLIWKQLQEGHLGMIPIILVTSRWGGHYNSAGFYASYGTKTLGTHH